MKNIFLAVALISVSGGALAGPSRASDLSGYLNNINESLSGNPQWSLPKWQTPRANQGPEELTVRNINNHTRGNNFYSGFTFRSNDTGERYELDIEPNAVTGYKLYEYGDTTFKARDRRTGEEVILKVPASAWKY